MTVCVCDCVCVTRCCDWVCVTMREMLLKREAKIKEKDVRRGKKSKPWQVIQCVSQAQILVFDGFA